MTQVLCILSGTSGAGKSEVIVNLKRHYGNGHVLTITTRERKPHEAPDAYRFVNDAELNRMGAQGETIWVIGQYGNRYSITESDIFRPLLENDGVAFVAVTPDYHSFLAHWCRRNGIVPINVHLVAPDPEEQKLRLIERDGKNFNPGRIDPNVNAKFEADAAAASKEVELHFIKQDTPEAMFEAVRALIDVARALS